jgi:hypothetical protein
MGLAITWKFVLITGAVSKFVQKPARQAALSFCVHRS